LGLSSSGPKKGLSRKLKRLWDKVRGKQAA
jgi:hypothetical protein